MNACFFNSLKYYQFEFWGHLKHGIFTRLGGVSHAPWDSLNIGGTAGDDVIATRTNQGLMCKALDVNEEQVCTVWLVHGVDTVIVNSPVQGRRWIAQADAMITNRLETPLVMRYADCVPLLFYDPVKKVIGIGHAGWRGTVMGIGSSVVNAMVNAYGSHPQDIQVGIGPAIGPDKYQVGEEVVEAVQDYFGTIEGDAPEGSLIRRDPADGTAYFNIGAANRLDLERSKVTQIEVAGLCTATRTDEFFSHRAERGRTGRFGVVISL